MNLPSFLARGQGIKSKKKKKGGGEQGKRLEIQTPAFSFSFPALKQGKIRLVQAHVGSSWSEDQKL